MSELQRGNSAKKTSKQSVFSTGTWLFCAGIGTGIGALFDNIGIGAAIGSAAGFVLVSVTRARDGRPGA